MTISAGTAVERQMKLERGSSVAVERKPLPELDIKIYADGADKGAMLEMYANPPDRRLHDESDTDAEVGRERLLLFQLDRAN